jgi:hypothetical protein
MNPFGIGALVEQKGRKVRKSEGVERKIKSILAQRSDL